MLVLVTGGAGFIGSHIVDALTQRGIAVRVVDNLSTGKMENLERSLERIEFVRGDLTDLSVCQRVMKDVTVVCHQAALGSVPRSVADPLNSHASNTTAFLNLLTVAQKNGVRRFVYASSSSVYGDDPHEIKFEDVRGEPVSPYAVTKMVDELYANVYNRLYGMQCVGLRYFNVFGPRQNPDGPYSAVIPSVMKKLVKGCLPVINGDGTQTRGFTYIDDVVRANLELLLTDLKTEHRVFNIGSGESTSIVDLVQEIQRCYGSPLEAIHTQWRAGDVQHSRADVSLAFREFSWRPLTSLGEGLQMTVDWFREHLRQDTGKNVRDIHEDRLEKEIP